MNSIPDDLAVNLAMRALQAFGGDLTREQAAALLPMWRYYSDLRAADRAAVLERFPRGRIEPGNSGPGW